jgi:hypothetical protein
MIESLLKDTVSQRIKVYQSASNTGTITSDAVDTAGCEGVLFVVTLGTVSTGGLATCKLQQSSDDASADAYADIEGSELVSTGDAASTLKMLIEIKNPQERYLKLLLTRSVANVVVDSIDAIKFGFKKLPITADATVDGSLYLVGPKEGTA